MKVACRTYERERKREGEITQKERKSNRERIQSACMGEKASDDAKRQRENERESENERERE